MNVGICTGTSFWKRSESITNWDERDRIMEAQQNETERAANAIGKYLLGGWVMTDEACRTTSCNVPLMRSKDGTKWFCVICDGDPSNANRKPSVSQNSLYTMSQNISPNTEGDALNQTDENQARQQQSKLASHLIGQHLLQGWALIDEICPSNTCYGVPLIRARDRKKYCVICKNYYLSESELDQSRNINRIITNEIGSSQTLVKQEKKHELEEDIQYNPAKRNKIDCETQSSDTIQQLEKEAERVTLLSSQNTSKQQTDSTIFTAGSLTVSSNTSITTVEKKTIITIREKLEQLRLKLTLSNEPKEIMEICDSIKSCAQALDVLNGYSNRQMYY
ncbi:2713_t:CDS:2 [Ambispora gerdemannii]|uniref:2713_t:CDS:1 n=1 Tax=Ambispora gerdemannii TaxID=144530 RepID=A0A9N9F3Y9_9GLOM|nr:2713_t:CDS:2 [Ambispora gerdemannii]